MDSVSVIGQKYGPALTAAGAVMAGLGATIEVVTTATTALKNAQIVQAAATKIAAAAQWLWNAAMTANPIGLVVAAIAALVAGLVLAYKHVGWFRDAVDAMGRAVLGVFKWIVNGFADLWNGTIGRIHLSIPSWIPGIGGKSFSVPQIPHLAQGGLITQTGFVYAHAGEAITPAPVHSGPAVVVENAHFSSGIDVDVFMRRAAWVVQTSRV
jgi:hypothetical protein